MNTLVKESRIGAEIREILEMLKVQENIIEAIEDVTAITLIKDEDNILKIQIGGDLAYDLYCSDLIDTSDLKEISILDTLYSGEHAFSQSYKYAGYCKERIMKNTFDPKITAHQTVLVCYLLTRINDYKYSQYKTIHDVKEPIPFQVYKSLLNSSSETIEICIEEDGITYAGCLDEIIINQTMFDTQVVAYVDIISSKGVDGYVKGKIPVELHPKMFVQNLEDLGFTPITKELKAELTEKGRHYVKITQKPHYCECHGEAYTKGWMGDVRHRVDSRVMIDVSSFRLLNPRLNKGWFAGDIFNADCNVGKEVPEELLWMCSPVVYGFSFGNKMWCKMYASDITDIKFSENAFDELIIPQENKDVFVASLTNDMPSLDSISGKGAGKIFLLYGAPGVGKTMTAESVAEFLQKPLYYVSVGELGIRPEELEQALDNVMKVANSWDAIILLDEVDVFAVKRDGASIERNAMTAIFLRMLERYSGIMFMTTNLLENLDDAFVSRSTAVIKYHDLTVEDRKKIWKGLIDKVISLNTIEVDMSKIDLDVLSTEQLNGRVIKNTVRLAYSLAISKGEALTDKHISTALKLRQC